MFTGKGSPYIRVIILACQKEGSNRKKERARERYFSGFDEPFIKRFRCWTLRIRRWTFPFHPYHSAFHPCLHLLRHPNLNLSPKTFRRPWIQMWVLLPSGEVYLHQLQED